MTATKPDFDRLGCFKEMAYTSIGDPYVDPWRRDSLSERVKGKQLFSTPDRARCGLNHGYFDDFRRCYTGDGLTNMAKKRFQDRLAQSKLNIQPLFVTASGTKTTNGSGSMYGTFTRGVPYFSSARLPTPHQPQGQNIMTNPPKKGTGYGYASVTIGKLPRYECSLYIGRTSYRENNERHRALLDGRRDFIANGHVDYFGPDPYQSKLGSRPEPPPAPVSRDPLETIFRPGNPGKLPGGCHAGQFIPFPQHIPDMYVDPYRRDRPAKETKVFLPSSGPKSMRTESVMQAYINKTINSSNFADK